MYFGSVRFYKNLILAVIIIAIGLGIGFSIHYHSAWKDTDQELNSLKSATSQFLTEDENGRLFLSSDDLSYQALYPDFFNPQVPVTSVQDDNTIYLTFNDGPSGDTAALLDALREKNIRATFFVTGASADGNSAALLQRIIREGHTLGMLSWSNDYSVIYQSVEAYLDDMYSLYTYLKDTTGVAPTVFRFPGGSVNSYNAGIYQEIISEMLRRGFVPFDWNVSAQDALSSAPEIVSRVTSLSSTLPRSIVLMHDASPETIQAIPEIVDTMKAAGFSFAPLTERVKPILFSY